MTAFQRPALLNGEVFRATSSTASAWSVLRPWQQGLFIVLSVAILCSALAVVLVQHAHRQEMRMLHAGMNARDQLNHAWSQLLVEQSAWAAMDHVELAAREKYGMVVPELDQVTYLSVDASLRGRRIAKEGEQKEEYQKESRQRLREHGNAAALSLLAQQQSHEEKSTLRVARPES